MQFGTNPALMFMKGNFYVPIREYYEMRKIIRLGLFALILSIFSSQVLASNVAACDEVKKSKGLHGLCVAWHNANDKNKDKFADKYFERSGGLSVPGSDSFECVCWSDLKYSQVCDIANSPTAVAKPGVNAITFFDFPIQTVTGFGADTESCISIIFNTSNGTFDREISEDSFNPDFDASTCVAEVQVISTFQEPGVCD
jgi:hypothetical protein